jgi:hypothetical protein
LLSAGIAWLSRSAREGFARSDVRHLANRCTSGLANL